MIFSGWLLAVWFLIYGDYFPEWFFLPRPKIADLLQISIPCTLFFLLFLPGLLFIYLSWKLFMNNNLADLTQNTITKKIVLAGILVVSISLLPWMFGRVIQNRLIFYGLNRYDAIINVLENYKNLAGDYPESIEQLIPEFLPDEPKVFFKFAHSVSYSYDPESIFSSPFDFSINGNLGISGRDIKYCPESNEKCRSLSEKNPTQIQRINHNWVLFFYPGL